MRALAALALSLTFVAAAEVADAHESPPATVAGADAAHTPLAGGATTAARDDTVSSVARARMSGRAVDESGPRGAPGPTWLWMGVASGAAATWLALGSWPRRSRRTETAGVPAARADAVVTTLPGSVSAPDLVLAGALAVTGVVHVFETESHWAEGWHLGLFFAASGAVLLGQAAAAVTGANRELYASVMVTTLGLIVLYVLARQLSLPLVGHRDRYVLAELPIKAIEIGAAGLSLLRLVRPRSRSPSSAECWPTERSSQQELTKDLAPSARAPGRATGTVPRTRPVPSARLRPIRSGFAPLPSRAPR